MTYQQEMESRHEAARIIRHRMTAAVGHDWTILKHAMDYLYAPDPIAPVPYVEVNTETAYGLTQQLPFSIRVF